MKSDKENKMGYSTPDIIIIIVVVIIIIIIIIMTQECKTVEAMDMQMARQWCDKSWR